MFWKIADFFKSPKKEKMKVVSGDSLNEYIKLYVKICKGNLRKCRIIADSPDYRLPSDELVKRFLKEDMTDMIEYSDTDMTKPICSDFALIFVGAFRKKYPKTAMGMIGIDNPKDKFGHVRAIYLNNKFIFKNVEPQTDEVILIKKDIPDFVVM